ncbi:hypothetical protein [Shewanella sediminis]|uniref:hypothetical protein n=1 Tax=Shewanella sediminis TaxID=271097 RepID=UPI00059C5467|nr:hypothetical protein [Shewanella sediminis]
MQVILTFDTHEVGNASVIQIGEKLTCFEVDVVVQKINTEESDAGKVITVYAETLPPSMDLVF